jgi:7-carboxy-7-deazaguanine synthase
LQEAAVLRVSEIFYSLQGESTFAGLPCVFVRLAGCNLRCRYCDTRYARDPGSGRETTLDEIIARVQAYGVPLVEITGGEPLLQDATPELIFRLRRRECTVLIETNGSIPLAGLAALDERVHLIIDVKTPGSGEEGSFRAENLALLNPRHQLKFVLCDEEDFFWSRDFLRRVPAGIEVVFSPVLEAFKPARLAELMLEHKVRARLQLQLHKALWPEVGRGR